jgi:thymidine kinase
LIASRAGIERKADVVVHPHTNLLEIPLQIRDVHCILVDEVQFLEPAHIEQLRSITVLWMIPVVRHHG